MEKELISAFVDSELNEKELEQMQGEGWQEIREVINIYAVIGESIRYSQSQVQVREQCQNRLKEALQQEYADQCLSESENQSDSSPERVLKVETVREESVI